MMPIRNVPFTRLNPMSPWRPMLPLRISNYHIDNDMYVDAWGIIDTGADACAIPEVLARRIGHEIKGKGVETANVSTASRIADVYVHTFNIGVYGFTKGRPEKQIVDYDNIVIDIQNIKIDVLPGLDYVLIGVNNFLCNYVLNIDYPEQKFSLIQQ